MALLGTRRNVRLRARTASSLLVVALLVASGCVGESGGTGSQPESTDPLDGSQGSVQGHVTDLSFIPLGNATVTALNDPNVTALTDPSGYYRLDHLPEGHIALQAFYPGFAPDVRSTFVEVEKAKNLSFQLSQLAVDVLEDPYQENWTYSGFVGCSTPAGDLLGCADPNHDPWDEFQTKINLWGLVFEVQWQPGFVSTTDEMNFQIQAHNKPAASSTYQWDFPVKSGGIFQITQEMLTAQNPPYGNPNFHPAQENLTFNITASVPQPNLAMQQGYDIWISAFYVDPPQEGHSPKQAYERSGS